MYNVKSAREGWDRYFALAVTDKDGDAYAIERKTVPELERMLVADDARAKRLIGSGARVERVVFERWNNEAGVREEIHVPWRGAFKWADHDKSGGQVVAVLVGDSDTGDWRWPRLRAKSLRFNSEHHLVPIGSAGKPKHNLSAISVDGLGEIMRRDYDISRELEARQREAERFDATMEPIAHATVPEASASQVLAVAVAEEPAQGEEQDSGREVDR